MATRRMRSVSGERGKAIAANETRDSANERDVQFHPAIFSGGGNAPYPTFALYASSAAASTFIALRSFGSSSTYASRTSSRPSPGVA